MKFKDIPLKDLNFWCIKLERDIDKIVKQEIGKKYKVELISLNYEFCILEETPLYSLKYEIGDNDNEEEVISGETYIEENYTIDELSLILYGELKTKLFS